MKTIPNEKKDPFKHILEDLASGKTEKVLDALKALRDRGNEKTTREVIALLAKDPTPEIETEVLNYLMDLKSTDAVLPLIEAIEDPDLRAYKNALLSVFWQSNLDGSDHLVFFIEQAYDASYEEIIEIVTVVENLKGPFIEEEIFEALARLNEITDEETDEQKVRLLLGLSDVLNQL